MSTKKLRTYRLIDIYIGAINLNSVVDIKIDEAKAIITYYDKVQKKLEQLILLQGEREYDMIKTYVVRYNTAFHMASL